MTTTAEHLHYRIDDQVSGLGSRVYPNKLPQNPETPCVRYARVSSPDHNSAMGSDTGLVNTIYQVDVYGSEYNNATTGADQNALLVKQALQRYSATYSGHEIAAIYILDETDDYDSASNLHSVRLDIEVVHRE